LPIGLADRVVPVIESVEGAADFWPVERHWLARLRAERQIGDRQLALQDLRQGRADADRVGWSMRLGQRCEQTVHPAIRCRAAPGGTILDEELRIEVRTRRIGRARGMDKGELFIVPKRQKAGERRMQPETAVEWQCPLVRPRTADRYCWAGFVIGLVATRDDDVEAVNSATQEHHDQLLGPALCGCGPSRASEAAATQCRSTTSGNRACSWSLLSLPHPIYEV